MSDMFSPYASFALKSIGGESICKRYAWANKSNVGGVYQPDEDTSLGEWFTPSELSAGADLLGATASKFHLLCFDPVFGDNTVPPLEYRRQFREFVSTHVGVCPVFGVPSKALQQKAREQASSDDLHTWYFGEIRRDQKNLVDAPRAFLTMDLDSLDVGVNVAENNEMIETWLRALIEAAGLDWMQRDMLVHLSSSFGIKAPNTLKVHVEWHLEKPLTIEQQKSVAQYCNAKAAAAGYGPKVFDLAIYDSARMLFSEQPQLFYRQRVAGEIRPFKKPQPVQQRVRLFGNHDATPVRVPDEALQYVPESAHERVWDVKLKDEQRKQFASSRKFTDGNVHAATFHTIGDAVKKTPRRHWRKKQRETFAYIEQQVRAMPTTAGNRTRLDDLKRLPGIWQWWHDQVYGVVGSAVLNRPNTCTLKLSDAREVLRQSIARYMREAFQYVKEREDITKMMPELPKCVSVQVPPGVGKTTQLVSAITHTTLYDHKVDVRTPTLSLSRQIHEGLQSKFEGDDDALAKILFEQGRAQFCVPEMDPRCQRVEALGLSPRATVCQTCPHFKECGWIKQGENETATLRIGQHAHITSSLASIQTSGSDKIADVYILDESPFATFVGNKRPIVKVDELAREARRGVIMDRKRRRRLMEETADLQHWRGQVIGLLEGRHGNVNIELVRNFRDIDNAIEAEKLVRLQAWASMMDMFKPNGHMDEDELKRLAKQFECANVFYDIYRAIRASQEIKGRKHVFGLSLSHGLLELNVRNELPVPYQVRNVVLLDATSNRLLDQAIWGATHEISELKIEVEDGAYRLTQYIDRSYANNMFVPTDGRDAAVCRDNMRKLLNIIIRAQRKHGEVLVAGPKKVLTALRKTKMLPKGVHLQNYMALRGINKYENIRCLIAFGRHSPPMHEMEKMTEGFFFDAHFVENIEMLGRKGKLRRRNATRKLRGNKSITIQETYHPDPHVDAVMRQHTDAECIQAIHRARIVNRTKDNPVELIVLGTFDTGLEIDEYVNWTDADYDVAEYIEMAGYMPKSTSALVKTLFGGVLATYAQRTIQDKFTEIRRERETAWTKWSVVLEDGTKHVVEVSPKHAGTAAEVHALIAQDAPVRSVTRARDRSR